MPDIELYYNTITPLQLDILNALMSNSNFDNFRLVGGTALSLQIGHRKSADIDMFTDSEYGCLDFKLFDQYFHDHYPYVDTNQSQETGMGRTYYVGNHKHDCIKIDMWYTDNFVEDEVVVDKIRLASIPEIIAMKMDVISRGGRKKDFWDIHELKERMEIQQMLDLHQRRYPFSHDPVKILEKLTDFTQADDDFNPVCLRGKHWELIKLDLIEWVNDLRSV